MRWPWAKRNGESTAAREDATDRLRAAQEQTRRVDDAVARAELLAARTDRFARDVERAMRGHA